MSFLSTLSVNLTANVSPFSRALGAARRDIGGFASTVGKASGAVVYGLGQIGLAANTLKMIGGTFASIVTTPLTLAANLEQTNIAFEVLLGSAKQAETVFADLRKFAANTPFEFPELANAGKKLIAFGTEADDLIPTMTRLGDIGSALGIPITELADLYGKARVQGTLFAEDINQLTGRGINVITEFAKQLGVSQSEVKKLGSEGKITFKNLEQAFKDMTSTGGAFEGMMKRQSETMAGLWSTLKDNFGAIMADIATQISEGFDLKGILKQAGEYMSQWAGIISTWLDVAINDWDGFVGLMELRWQQFVLNAKAELRGLFDVWDDIKNVDFAEMVKQGISYSPVGRIAWLFSDDDDSVAKSNEALEEQIRLKTESLLKSREMRMEQKSFNKLMADAAKDPLMFGGGLLGGAAFSAGTPVKEFVPVIEQLAFKDFPFGKGEAGRSGDGVPSLLESGGVEAFRALAKFSQPQVKTMEQKADEQIALLQRIADGFDEPPAQIEFA